MSITGIRSILALVAPDGTGDLPASVGAALSLAGQTGARVTFHLYATRHEAPFSLAPGFVASLTGPANAEEATRLATAKQALEAKIAATGAMHDLTARQLRPADIVHTAGFHARLHDLTVMDAPHAYLDIGRALSEELLFNSGRPVITVPPGHDGRLSARRILVAWDGTSRATRAMHDAMPLLRAAAHVELVSVSNEKDLSQLVPGTEVAPFLARHGVDVTVTAVEAPDGDAGRALRERAQLTGAELMVMGAFAHSRWRQLVLGGVTSSMFEAATIPVFMSH